MSDQREIFLQTVRKVLRRTQEDSGRVQQTEERNPAFHANHDSVLSGAVGAGIRFVSALGRLTEDEDSDDPEEQKSKYEAQQAASNAGAILGLAIGAIETFTHNNQSLTRIPDEEQRIDQSGFQPYQPKRRKSGTGCVYQINDHLWEAKYSPVGADGKRISRNVYAKTKEECEEKLAVMIEEVKRENEQQKQRIQQQSQSEMVKQ